MRRLLAFCLTIGLLNSSLGKLSAAGPDPIPLWPAGAPGAVGTEPADIPQLRFYPADPKIATGACIEVLPGGGYAHLATDHEGHQIATWLNSIGVSAAVVTYRLGPRYRHPAPLQDAQRGIRYLRAHAKELKIDPNRIGVLGFSAGGHLASTVSTHFDKGDSSSSDPIAQQSSRPDFSVLCYPVISLKSSFTHGGSKKNLLGETPDQALVEKLSNETQVNKETPPTFIFHTTEDKAVPVQNALVYYQACVAHGVPAELHVYQKGRHGVGLATGDPVLNTWKDRLEDWLKVNGILSVKEHAAVKGSVSFKGQPLARGTIAFNSVDDQYAATSWSTIGNGKFSFSTADGPVLGENKVTIYAFSPPAPYPADAPVLVEQDLKVNVVAGPNEFSFDIP